MENDSIHADRPLEGSGEPDGGLKRDDLERTGDAVGAVDALLEAVEQALARLDDGTYGTCSSCGLPIDDAELATTPTRQRCEDCSTAVSRSDTDGARTDIGAASAESGPSDERPTTPTWANDAR